MQLPERAAPIGVLVMAYGGPDTIDDVEPYLLDVRGFRPTAAHILNDVRSRYAAIGGRSPILERTRAQAAAIERALASDGDDAWRVVLGMRHWNPRIKEALGELERDGITRAVGVVMAPHYSRMSVGAYERNVANASSPVETRTIQSWHLLPGYVQALAERVQLALARFPEAERDDVEVLFTAHSLPQKILEWNDPYPDQLAATVRAVMELLGDRPHRFAFQSAAMTTEPWLGPDASVALGTIAGEGGRNVVITPIGFTCEHVEILYDVDIEFQRRAAELGLRLERVPMLDDAPVAMAGIADMVRESAHVAGWR